MNWRNTVHYYNGSIATSWWNNPMCPTDGCSKGAASFVVRSLFCEHYHLGNCTRSWINCNIAQLVAEGTLLICIKCAQISCMQHHIKHPNRMVNFECDYCLDQEPEDQQ